MSITVEDFYERTKAIPTDTIILVNGDPVTAVHLMQASKGAQGVAVPFVTLYTEALKKEKKTKRLLVKAIYPDGVARTETIPGVTAWHVVDGDLTVMSGGLKSYFPKESFVYVEEQAETDD